MPGIRQLKNYFHFNRGERRGLVVLLIILLLVLLSNMLMPYFTGPPEHDITDFQNAIAAYEKRQVEIQDSLQATRQKAKSNSQLKPVLFDPNTITLEGWMNMGLSEKQARVIENYKAKGGHFNKPADLKKIYSLSAKEYSALSPFIRIRDSQADPTGKTPETKTSALLEDTPGVKADSLQTFTASENEAKPYLPSLDQPIELNAADTLSLQKLYGIGPSFARRIVKYRDLLGGYVYTRQLMEVYGFDSMRFMGIREQLIIDTTLIQKIMVNSASIRELIRHPYIDFYLAKKIVSERDNAGGYRNQTEFKDRLYLPDTIIRRIYPYFDFR